MSYVPVEADERIEEGQPELEFKSTVESSRVSPPCPLHGTGFISDHRGPASPWSLEYYQEFFDVDTKTVVFRCISTLNPFSPTYTSAHLNPGPDLYGPFWSLTTLIFTLFVTSSLASSIASYLSDSPITYDFTLLSVAVGIVYSYGLAVPTFLWALLRYWGVIGAAGEGWGLIEALSVWGYAMFVWIPVSILCVIPIAIMRWTLVGVAFGLSGYFLVANVYPILASADHKAARLLIVVVAILHATLALIFKIIYYVIKEIGPKDPTGEAPAHRSFMSRL
ncbi:Yip1-domain-containing protein [Vararia minispora EC-137]|uniref:Yip1-domain-containing protein n=1 Tax=Vararia minispora EC-137 TaxID=1314806 RepID=A0ACB8QCF0_9AGAM|nr:Yip1-domain-containing protein [Vararia minispora EC-137]